MTAMHLIVLLIGIALIALIFLLSGRGSGQTRNWIGVVTSVLAAPFFFWLGAFTEQFDSGLCYSRSIDLIANAVAKTDAPISLAKQINSLPLHGYETVCSEVELSSKQLPGASEP